MTDPNTMTPAEQLRAAVDWCNGQHEDLLDMCPNVPFLLNLHRRCTYILGNFDIHEAAELTDDDLERFAKNSKPGENRTLANLRTARGACRRLIAKLARTA